jgi:hypothetical protein
MKVWNFARTLVRFRRRIRHRHSAEVDSGNQRQARVALLRRAEEMSKSPEVRDLVRTDPLFGPVPTHRTALDAPAIRV